MTETIERVFEHLPSILDRRKVCDACRDRSMCAECPFNLNEAGKGGFAP